MQSNIKPLCFRTLNVFISCMRKITTFFDDSTTDSHFFLYKGDKGWNEKKLFPFV